MKRAAAKAAANWHRMYAMPVTSVYPAYIAKAQKKGRIRAEVDEIFRWLTGHSQTSLEANFSNKTSFEDFFAHAPKMNPSRSLITGVVCGVRVGEIQELFEGPFSKGLGGKKRYMRATRTAWRSTG